MSAAKKVKPIVSALSNVLKQVAPDGSVQPKTPTDKASPATLALEELQTICDPDQQSAVGRFWDAAKALHAEVTSKQALFDTLVTAIHPTGVAPYGVYSAIVAYLTTRSAEGGAGDYAAKCYRMSVRRLAGMGCTRDAAGKIEKLGDLPMKGKSKGGAKGTNAAKWFKGVHRGLKTMMDRVAKVPKDLIDAPALVAWTAAYKAMVAADKALAKAIANDVKAGKAPKRKAK